MYSRGVSLAEFEEKELEGPLNGQLGRGGPMWSPGQVLEQLVGFDVAMFTQNAVFWAAQGHSAPPQGAVVLSAWWPLGITRLADPGRRPPSFRMNVFLQYKRPDYLARPYAGEWPTWNRAYFRFWITSHQQAALDACAAGLGTNGLVAHASPAFHTREDLFQHVEHGTLLVNTHFAPSARISGHDRYTYVDATTPGRAHSEPVIIEPLAVLNGQSGHGGGPPERPSGGADGLPPRELLAAARRAAEAAVAASPQLVGNAVLLTATVRRATTFLAAVQDPKRDDPSVQDFIYAATFSAMSGIGWAVL